MGILVKQTEQEYSEEDLQKARQEYDEEDYYDNKLEQGVEFQDVVTEALYQRGIVVVAYSSRRNQAEKGENMLGAEIKRDGKFRETGNLYIETSEKSHPDNPFFVPSGIFRGDNSWLFVIGDEQTIYIFSTKYLQKLFNLKRYVEICKPTSQGFLMPMPEVENYCIRRIDL